MAIDKLVRRVLIKYEADTKGAEDGADKLKKKADENKKSWLEWAKAANEGLNSTMESLGKFNQAFEGARKIVEIASDTLKEYTTHSRLVAAAGSADLERLSKAAGGLRNEEELLTFAARAQHGVIKANQEQMETAEKAMRMLTRAGFDQAEVSKKIEDAMVSLKVNGLDDLGISVQKGATDLDTYNNLMDALAQKAQGADSATDTQAETMQRFGVRVHDAFNRIKVAIGELVIAMEPLLEKLADAVELIARIAEGKTGKQVGGAARNWFQSQYLGSGIADEQSQLISDEEARQAATAKGIQRENDEIAKAQARARQIADKWYSDSKIDESRLFGSLDHLDAYLDKLEKQKERAQKLAEEQRKLSGELAKSYTDALVARLEEEVANETMDRNGIALPSGSDMAAMNAQFGITSERLAKIAADQTRAAQGGKFLESTFGKLDEFNAYASAFQALTSAVAASYEALVTGSEPAGKAFRKMLADGLLALGKAEVVESLKELAYAVGALALGPEAAGPAALHFKSAAMHAAVATLAGVTASGLGAGSGSASGGASGGASSNANAPKTPMPSGPGQGERVIVYLGDTWNGETPRSRRATIEGAVNQALGNTSAGVAR